ncbi:hypothetical protein J5N97_009146 [Dioscorea zingiberensis]|uniref:Bifunctional inhibitor/plant lipid transfer protein/seed storage helical domain-containing protein n=1 Tax=Dioscorea zingiberensis TaxID=325984 RepID=A0A9D5CWM5_9LILI|nr:hypothetical protein J5N97_009146 [Dioscorea zingiberensis]
MVRIQGALVYTILMAAIFMAGLVSGDRRNLSDDCGGSLPNLMTQCQEFVKIPGPPKDPSQTCCDAVQVADVPCICTKITDEIQKIISMQKVTFCAQKCGRPLSPGTKCGSYTVPDPPPEE